MEHIHRMRRMPGSGRAACALVLAGLWTVSCRPGTLPCDDPEWKDVCEGDGGTSTNGGQGGGGTGGMGGGGTDGGPVTCRYTSTREVAEKLILPSCGGMMGALCHLTAFEPKFSNVDQIQALLDKTAVSLCKMDKYVNKADPAKSFFVLKAKGASDKVACPTGGGNGGDRMPYKLPQLPQADLDCLEWWANELSK